MQEKKSEIRKTSHKDREIWCWPCDWENKIINYPYLFKMSELSDCFGSHAPSLPCVPNSRWCGIGLQGLGEGCLSPLLSSETCVAKYF